MEKNIPGLKYIKATLNQQDFEWLLSKEGLRNDFNCPANIQMQLRAKNKGRRMLCRKYSHRSSIQHLTLQVNSETIQGTSYQCLFNAPKILARLLPTVFSCNRKKLFFLEVMLFVLI